MAFNKRTWKGRQGTGLNKFSIDGATPVTVINQPDSVTEQGDALSAGNLNDLEDRIYTAFEDEATARANADSNLKDAITANSNRISNLEQEHGGYVPVNYRGSNDVPTGKAKYALVESIVGKSRAWNQLQYNGNFASSDGWSGGTVSSGHIEASGSAGSYSRVNTTSNNPPIIEGHKYLVYAKMKAISGLESGETSYNLRINGTGSSFNTIGFSSTGIPNGTTITMSGIFTASANNADASPLKYFGCYNNTNAHVVQWSNCIIRDLTLIFGSGNEPSTVAEAVALCPSILEYDAYGTSMVDETVTGVKSISRNRFDHSTVLVGAIKSGDGTVEEDTSWKCSDYIEIHASTNIYLKVIAKNSSAYGYAWYDGNKNYISGQNYPTADVTVGIKTSPSNARYLRFSIHLATNPNFADNVCINVTDSQDGIFTQYFTATLTLPSSVTLRSAGSVAEVYDLESGEVTRPIGAVDLGTLDWSIKSGASHTFKSWGIDTIVKAGGFAVVPNAVCSSLVVDTYNHAFDDATTVDKTISIGPYKDIGFTDSNISSSDIVNNKIAKLNGVMFYFELATPDDPTQLTPVINNTIQTEGGGTINTIQTQTPVIDNCLDVGYLAL